MRVALFRALADGERTAEQLRARGHGVLLAPVLAIVPTGAMVPPERPHATIFTSAHGVEAVCGDARLAALHDLPCFCVGSRTAARAYDIGFNDIRNARADATALAALIEQTFDRPSHLLLIGGHDRKPTLEQMLTNRHRLSVVIAYEAREIAWSAAIRASLDEPAFDAALHYSRRSAALALDAAKAAGLFAPLLAATHYCLSADAAAPLRAAGCARIMIADRPDEERLLALLP